MSTAVEDLFPTAHWNPSATAQSWSDSNTGGEVLTQKGVVAQGQLDAAHTDPSSGTVDDLFGGPRIPTVNMTTMPVPGGANYDPLKRLYKG